jgi:glycoside/pentoside/hexuronide:cation symporter, GPH family
MDETTGQKQRLPATLRHGYGVTAAALSLANTPIMFFLLKFLTDEARLTPALAGSVLLVGKIWDAVNDPIVGKLSDATRTRFGARRPWMAVGALPFALLFAAIWWNFGGSPMGGPIWKAVAFAALLILYDTAYTCVVVPYGALTPAITRDYDERTKLNGARMGWSMVGGIVAGVGFPMMFQTWSWTVAGLVLGFAMLPLLMVTLWSTRGQDHLTEIPTEHKGSLLTVLKVRAFRRTAILFLLAWSTINAVSALIPFYMQHQVHQPKQVDTVFAAIQIAALVTIPGVVWLARRFQKHLAYAICMAGWSMVLLALSVVPEGMLTPVVILAVLAGPGVAAAHVLPWSMLPDVVEEDRVTTGEDRAGIFYGAMTFIEKLGTATILWVLGLVLEFSGYVEGAASQPESARLAICALIGPLPVVMLGTAAFLAWRRPPMTRQAHRDMVVRLTEVA